MEDPETSQIVEEFSLFDVSSSDDDFLLASSSGEVLAEGACINHLSDCIGFPKPKRNGKCNLRKSLAWDSAFFTSAGVLEPEELSSIMEEAETSVKPKHFLPGIEEDLSKSTDSVSTFESDLTLESLEADLFTDIRASIQRCSRPSAQGSHNYQIHGESKNGCSTKIVEPPPGNMVKPKLVFMKRNPGVQGPVKLLKPGSGIKQVTKPAVSGRVASSLLPRLPGAAGKPSLTGAAASKRMSISAGRIKLESNAMGNLKEAARNGAASSKASHQTESRNSEPKTMTASRLSGSSVSSRAAMRSSRSSCGSSGSSSSDNCKTQSDGFRRKIDKNANFPPGAKIRAPSRVAVKSKCRTGESNLSNYVKSTTSLSSSVSPRSSVSEWSTESSSSTATVKQKHIGYKPGPSSDDVIVDTRVSHKTQSNSSCKFFDGHENPVGGMLNQSAKQPSAVICVPPSRPGSAKPSGLRLPSAKIGFFDGVKSGTKTPNTNLRSRSALPSSLSKSAAGFCMPSGSVSKTKPGNTAAKVIYTVAETVTLEQCSTDANIKPIVHLEDHDHSRVLHKVSNAENGVDVSNISCKVQENGLANSAEGTNDKVTPVVDEGKHLPLLEVDDMKMVSIIPCQDVGGSEGLAVTNAMCDSSSETIYTKQNITDNKMEMKRGTEEDSQSQNVTSDEKSFCSTVRPYPKHLCNAKQSESAESANLILCSMSCFGASSGTRTPFNVKNSRSNMVDACNFSLPSAAEALVKVDAMPFLVETEKENS